jgi:hypothetical protein
VPVRSERCAANERKRAEDADGGHPFSYSRISDSENVNQKYFNWQIRTDLLTRLADLVLKIRLPHDDDGTVRRLHSQRGQRPLETRYNIDRMRHRQARAALPLRQEATPDVEGGLE